MWVLLIDDKNCEADGDCIEVCPLHMLAMEEVNGKKRVYLNGNPEDCAYCFACVSACTTDSIQIVEKQQA